MAEAWLPIAFSLPQGSRTSVVIESGEEWQIVGTAAGGRALLAKGSLAECWTHDGLVAPEQVVRMAFGGTDYLVIESGPDHVLASVPRCDSPSSQVEALSFAAALRATREIDPVSALDGGIYVEKLSRILPVYTTERTADDEILLGTWLTGGLRVSVFPLQRLGQLLSWLPTDQLGSVVEAAGIPVKRFEGPGEEATPASPLLGDEERSVPNGPFSLPGRRFLEDFFNDHVIDVVQNREQYRALGIENPAAIILEGPPGCGKTFAVKKLVKFLGWPLFAIEAMTIGSPFIHETSRKVGEVFERAMTAAPSVIVIDEMDAFLSEREGGATGQHRVEEIAEFLRKIPNAVASGVLVIGMTNRVDLIDKAILRRGRFDHVIKVDYPGIEEVRDLLDAILSAIPTAADVDLDTLAARLAGRPLSDVSFVIRESARLAAKDRRPNIDAACLQAALAATPPRDPEARQRPIGFIHSAADRP